MGKLLRDETYIEQMNKQNALLEVLVADKLASASANWAEIAKIIKGGYGSYVYYPGDQFSDTWADAYATGGSKEYTYPWHVASHRTVTLSDGETKSGMIIQAHYAHPFGVQFSHQRAFLACPSGLVAGTYYFTIESAWGTNVAANDVVCFTTTQSVPQGGCIAGCYGAPDQAKSNWRIYLYAADRTTILETIVPTFTTPDSGTNLGTQHLNKRDGNLNSTQEMAYGWNRWSTSALRQYLNSSADKGAWWTAQDEWDIAPNELASKAGFMAGLPEELVNAIKPVQVTTYTNTVQDGGTADITYDKFFLPALQEIHVNPQIQGEGEAWEYWTQVSGSVTPLAQYGTYSQMITYAVENHVSPQNVRLRSARRGGAISTWSVGSSGNVNYGAASSSYRFSPACVIC